MLFLWEASSIVLLQQLLLKWRTFFMNVQRLFSMKLLTGYPSDFFFFTAAIKSIWNFVIPNRSNKPKTNILSFERKINRKNYICKQWLNNTEVINVYWSWERLSFHIAIFLTVITISFFFDRWNPLNSPVHAIEQLLVIIRFKSIQKYPFFLSYNVFFDVEFELDIRFLLSDLVCEISGEIPKK